MAAEPEGRADMARRSTYSTRQRGLILGLLAGHPDAFLTVDEVLAGLTAGGARVGRTTVYRTLEALVAEGVMAKVADVRGGAARYRMLAAAAGEAPAGASAHGQLRCVSCGKIIPLDCDMLGTFARHVEQDHGFTIDARRTVLYGLCADCRAAQAGRGGAAHA